MGEVIDFNLKIKYKDLENLARQLSQKTFDLMLANQELQIKLAHLEELLKHAPVLNIGGVKNEER